MKEIEHIFNKIKSFKNLKSCCFLKKIVEEKSYYKIELEMELGLDSLLSYYATLNLSILSYFGNKMEILLLFSKINKMIRK